MRHSHARLLQARHSGHGQHVAATHQNGVAFAVDQEADSIARLFVPQAMPDIGGRHHMVVGGPKFVVDHLENGREEGDLERRHIDPTIPWLRKCRKSSRRTASCTRSSAAVEPDPLPEIAREVVPCPSPASSVTSLMVGLAASQPGRGHVCGASSGSPFFEDQDVTAAFR